MYAIRSYYVNDGYYTIYDRIIFAIGGTAPIDFLKKVGIEVDNERNNFV